MKILSQSSGASYNDSDVASRKIARGWGGKRPGAGRKPVLKDPVTTTTDLERADVDFLEAIAGKRGVTVAYLVRTAVAAYVKRQKRS
jgi:hypothetical protein